MDKKIISQIVERCRSNPDLIQKLLENYICVFEAFKDLNENVREDSVEMWQKVGVAMEQAEEFNELISYE